MQMIQHNLAGKWMELDNKIYDPTAKHQFEIFWPTAKPQYTIPRPQYRMKTASKVNEIKQSKETDTEIQQPRTTKLVQLIQFQ